MVFKIVQIIPRSFVLDLHIFIDSVLNFYLFKLRIFQYIFFENLKKKDKHKILSLLFQPNNSFHHVDIEIFCGLV